MRETSSLGSFLFPSVGADPDSNFPEIKDDSPPYDEQEEADQDVDAAAEELGFAEASIEVEA